MSEMPAVIMRPSIVIPIRYEPIPGWTDNINGPTGLLIGAGKGVIRSMYCNPNTYGDYVPVDYAVNGIMVSSWNFVYNKLVLLNFNIICNTILHRHNTYMHHAHTHTPTNVVCLLFIYCDTLKHFYCYYRDYNRRIYHLVSSPEIKVSWKELIDCGRWIIMNKLPLNGVVWYPGGSMKSNRLLHNICCIFFHWIPAILIDCLLWCLRYPPVYVKRSIEFNAISLYFIFFSRSQYFSIHSTIIEQLINCQIFPVSDCAVCNDEFKKVLMSLNITVAINGILTTPMFSICVQSSMMWNLSDMPSKTNVCSIEKKNSFQTKTKN